MLHSLAGFLLTATSLIHHAIGATVSLDDSGTFQAQRPCAQRCYSGGVGDSFRVLQEIGCESLPGSNDCYCRADLQDQAQAYISSCVWSACASKTQDLNIATQLYIDYCTSNGFLRDAGVTTAAPVTTASQGVTSPSSISAQSSSPPTTSTPATQGNAVSSSSSPSPTSPGSASSTAANNANSESSSPASSNNNGNDKDGLGTGEIIGIVVGILGFFATVAGIYFSYKMYKNQRAANAAATQQQQYEPEAAYTMEETPTGTKQFTNSPMYRSQNPWTRYR